MTSVDSNLEIDHLFVLVQSQAPEKKLLEDCGLHWSGDVIHHAGQGTSSAVFFFENTYLELLWLDDLDLAIQNVSSSLPERMDWQNNKKCPFGIGLKRTTHLEAPFPFPTRKYSAPWMRANTFIELATTNDTDTSEPMCFLVPKYMTYKGSTESEHALGVQRLTSIRITIGDTDLVTPVSRLLSQNGHIRFQFGDRPELELTFEHGASGKSIEFDSSLPIRIRY